MRGRAWARKQSSKTNEENAPKLITSSGKKNKSADRLSVLPSSQADGKKEKSPCRGSGWRPVASVPDAPPSQEEYVETEVSGLRALPPRTFVGASGNSKGEVTETEDPFLYTGRPATDQEDVNMHHPASGEMQLEMQSVGPSDFPPVIAPAGGYSQNEEVVLMLLGVLHSTLQTQKKPERAERRTAKQQRKRERKKEAKHQAQLYTIRQTRTGDHQTTLGGSPQKHPAAAQLDDSSEEVFEERGREEKELQPVLPAGLPTGAFPEVEPRTSFDLSSGSPMMALAGGDGQITITAAEGPYPAEEKRKSREDEGEEEKEKGNKE
eukprot:Cvel_24806.t1-p1 / transcript=Cvel_24806.t1 / gene=Cvel_24806 / organism=Chromera_velia_CCMP2878 / gene_product=hypothetical protein / transcript_product=hypothetical protein / location=Cvel_scaffold2732:13715-17013(-) / protein_length=321 / sequence_SO=supercontig / SO=protein_coding / is_pseudo=false